MIRAKDAKEKNMSEKMKPDHTPLMMQHCTELYEEIMRDHKPLSKIIIVKDNEPLLRVLGDSGKAMGEDGSPSEDSQDGSSGYQSV